MATAFKKLIMLPVHKNMLWKQGFKMILKITIFIAITFQVVVASDVPCSHSSINTCGKCISKPGCAWCYSQSKGGNSAMCGTSDGKWCEETLINPTYDMHITQNDSLNTTPGNVIQISPQKVHIKARPGQVVQFDIKYQQALDYPLDLYYLMDMSLSMKDDKEKLSELGSKLASEMRRRSSNLRMGFGSFVDKVTMPFANTLADKRHCTDCAPPYEFRNHLSLTDQTDDFPTAVRDTQISGNVDAPEGGFDALMQVMVCKEEIGWRNESLKMIIFSTDAKSHYSGDGRLAGIVKPNDELCHMKNNTYTHGLLQDYPSVAQIRNNARKHNMNVIFAVTNNTKNFYVLLEEAIYKSKTAVLRGDSSNVVDLIKEEYDKLKQEVKIDYPTKDDHFQIKLFSNCLNVSTYNETDRCSVRDKGDIVHFRVELHVKKCLKEKSRKINLSPSSINELLEIDLEVDCECDCEKGDFSGEECSMQGNLKCGVCHCHEPFIGPKCNHTNDTINADVSTCTQNDEICSNRGTCVFGACVCEDPERYSGSYCECNKERCHPDANGKYCSGNGICDCEGCVCFEGWKSRPDCSCSDNKSTCMPPNGDSECSGHGECVCGKCVCKIEQGKGKYLGQFCEECSTCQDKCDDLKPCVQSFQLLKENGEYVPPVECEAFTMITVNNLDGTTLAETLNQNVAEDKENDEAEKNQKSPLVDTLSKSRVCSYYVDGCTYYYKYWKVQANGTFIFLHSNYDCAEPVDLWAVVGGLVGAILIAGIVMILTWKVATTIHDRKVFQKFEKERQVAMFSAGDNPLYQNPASTFNNPMFGQ